MLRAITIAGVIIAVGFIAWSMLVMTGGRDWLVASMTEEKAPVNMAAKEETQTAPEAEPDAAKPAEPAGAKPDTAAPEAAEPDTAQTEAAKPGTAADAEAKPEDAEPDAAEETAAAGKPAPSAGTGEAPPAPAGGEKAEGAEKPAAGAEAAGADPSGNPTETAKSAEKGSLTSPYQDSYQEVAEEGHKKFMSAGCNGCHGGTGGGGMGPPLSNPVWVYGNDGDTLFRLISLGTNGLQEQGYTRKGSENVVGPMPPHGNIVKSNDDLWKIIAWIWSINPPDKSASAAR